MRRFQQDDVIFCRPDQMEHELKQFLKLLDEARSFRVDDELKLSTPGGVPGEIEIWDQAEAALTKALNEPERVEAEPRRRRVLRSQD